MRSKATLWHWLRVAVLTGGLGAGGLAPQFNCRLNIDDDDNWWEDIFDDDDDIDFDFEFDD